MSLFPSEPWRRNQHVMTATVFVVYTGFAFVLPFLPLYVKQLGVVDDQRAALWGGVLIGIAPLLAGLLAPLWGRWADRHGQKRVAGRALGAYVVLMLATAFAQSVWQLLALRIGIGLFGGIGPLGLAMATSRAPRDQAGRAVGAIQAAQILSAAIGPFAGGLLADSIGMRATCAVTALLCLAALGLVLGCFEEAPREAPADPHASARLLEIVRLPHVLALLVVLFLVNFIGRSFTPILPAHLRSLGVPAARLALSTGLLISVYSVAAAASASALGRAASSRAPQGLLVATLFGGAAAVLPMTVAPAFSALLVLAVFLGLASGGSLTLCYTLGGRLVPAERHNAAFGFFAGAALFGGAVSPTVAGLLARYWELKGIYWLDGALYLLLAAALLLRPASLSRRAEG